MILNWKSSSVRYLEKLHRRRKWHKWFVWYPMRVSDTEVMWLETIYRRRSSYYAEWEYSLTNPEEVTE